MLSDEENTKSLITKLHKEFQCCVHQEEIPPSTFTATLFPNQLEQRPDKYEEKKFRKSKAYNFPNFFSLRAACWFEAD